MSFSVVVKLFSKEGVSTWKGIGSFSKDCVLNECISLDEVWGVLDKIEGQIVGVKGVTFGSLFSTEILLGCFGELRAKSFMSHSFCPPTLCRKPAIFFSSLHTPS